MEVIIHYSEFGLLILSSKYTSDSSSRIHQGYVLSIWVNIPLSHFAPSTLDTKSCPVGLVFLCGPALAQIKTLYTEVFMQRRSKWVLLTRRVGFVWTVVFHMGRQTPPSGSEAGAWRQLMNTNSSQLPLTYFWLLFDTSLVCICDGDFSLAWPIPKWSLPWTCEAQCH